MIEIMTSPGFDSVVSALRLKDVYEGYKYTPTEKSYWSDPFTVWEFTESEFNKLSSAFTEDEWQEKFPNLWWCYSEDTNIADDPDYEVHTFIFNSRPVKAWANLYVDHVIEDEDDDGQMFLTEYGYDYLNPLEYCVEEVGASSMKNIDAVCHGLAKLNHMSLFEFFTTYMEAVS